MSLLRRENRVCSRFLILFMIRLKDGPNKLALGTNTILSPCHFSRLFFEIMATFPDLYTVQNIYLRRGVQKLLSLIIKEKEKIAMKISNHLWSDSFTIHSLIIGWITNSDYSTETSLRTIAPYKNRIYFHIYYLCTLSKSLQFPLFTLYYLYWIEFPKHCESGRRSNCIEFYMFVSVVLFFCFRFGQKFKWDWKTFFPAMKNK